MFYMYEERGMSYRKISKWLNHSGIKTHEGNTWGVTGNSVYSVLKRMKEREKRVLEKRFTSESEIKNFKITHNQKNI
ncbi:recombinase family protein [Gammaproteobacteria bacterium]|nr:recombinase family protein [Gammaproteobacteria bacterium]